jgi:hypothetical protein
MTDKNECIICMEPDNLIKNADCSCNYFYHIDCYRKYGKTNCVLCKKETHTFIYILNPLISSIINENIPSTIINIESVQINESNLQENADCMYIYSFLCVLVVFIISAVIYLLITT